MRVGMQHISADITKKRLWTLSHRRFFLSFRCGECRPAFRPVIRGSIAKKAPFVKYTFSWHVRLTQNASQ